MGTLALPAWLQRTRGGIVSVAIAFGVATAVLAPLLSEQHLTNVTLIYLLGVLVAAALWGYRVGLFAALLGNLLVNVFYTPPLHRLTVYERGDVVALVLFLAVAVVGATMLSALRRQVLVARASETQTKILLELTHEVNAATTPRLALDALCRVIARSLAAGGCAVIDAAGWSVLGATFDTPSGLPPSQEEISAAREALKLGRPVALGGVSVAGHPVRRERVSLIPIPLREGEGAVLRLTGDLVAPPLVDRKGLISAFVSEAATAIAVARLASEVHRTEALQRADEFKSALLSSVSHDLRSPLTAIKAAVGNLRDPEITWADADRNAFLATIESQTDRLTRTVTNLLEMSRLEGGQVTVRIESLDVTPLLEEVADETRGRVPGRVVLVEGPEVETVSVRADHSLLVRALVNLAENAATYSTPGEPVHLRAEVAGQHVLLRVVDHGPGIPPVELDRVFERFYRGSGARRFGGSGLGLAIVKSMVELCHGTVSLRSSEGGTVFTIDLRGGQAARR